MIKNPFMTEEEHQQVLVTWNDTSIEYSKALCIHQLFEAQAHLTPNAIAVTIESECLTYEELNKRANQLAHHLRLYQIGPEVAVTIFLEHSLDMMVAILGVLKAGGAYVPLDSTYPKERLVTILQIIQSPFVITQKKFAQQIASQVADLICLDSEWDIISQSSTQNLTNLCSPENLAYIIFTSGSSGKPKGVLTTHSNLVSTYYAWEKAYELRLRVTNHCQIANFAFAVFQADWIRALCSGGRLILCSKEIVLNAKKLYQTLVQQGVDFVEFVPAVLRNLVEFLKETKQPLENLQTLVVGSDRWYVHEHQFLKQYCGPNTQVIHSFGLSETTIDNAYFEQTTSELKDGYLVPIGRPFPNVTIYILDSYLRPVPISISATLYIGGNGLARGYYGRPGLTSEKFIPHPFSTEPGARLYSTGDLASYLSDGNVQFLGREDTQVKVRGFRIELGEIEAILQQHPAVQKTVVVSQESAGREAKLIAYVVPHEAYKWRDFPLYELSENVKVMYQNKVETYQLYEKIFKQSAYLRHGIKLKDGDCVVDIGAHIGLFAYFANQQCRNMRLFAFEPSPTLFEILNRNMDLHDIKMQAFNIGVSKETRLAPFAFYPDASELSSFSPNEKEDKKMLKAISLYRLQNHVAHISSFPSYVDSLLDGQLKTIEHKESLLKTLSQVIHENKIAQIDLLKISAPKSELHILEGINEDDWKKIKQLTIEVYDVNGIDRIERLLKQNDFRAITEPIPLMEEVVMHHVYAIQNSKADNAVSSDLARITISSQPTQPVHNSQISWDVNTTSYELLMLSAETSPALEAKTSNLAYFLKQYPDLNLTDVAYSLWKFDEAMAHRRILICKNRTEAISLLSQSNSHQVLTQHLNGPTQERSIVFMHPGGGAQYVGMGYELYCSKTEFREQINRCGQVLTPLLGYDFRTFLYPAKENHDDIVLKQIKQPSVALPALFAVEYALAKQWMTMGIQPSALIGHSLGEYVAACLAGVFSLEDALALVVLRGQLFDQLLPGNMLSVQLSEEELKKICPPQLSIAAVNGPEQCVVAGSPEMIHHMKSLLTEHGVTHRQILIDVAAHSSMVEPILETFTQFVEKLSFHSPRIPFISNVTGTWIKETEATSPYYWTRHLRETVRFKDGISQLLHKPGQILLEVGPGRTLTSLTKLQIEPASPPLMLTSMPHYQDKQSATKHLLRSLGQLWLAGYKFDLTDYWHSKQPSLIHFAI